jgi:DnaJ-domain-containing protein 1
LLLGQLRTPEKFAFLRLAHFLAKTDGTYGDKEKELIDEYCFEMGIDNIEFNNDKLENILKEFKSKKSKKIALMELMILAHIDDTFNLYEYKTTQAIAEAFEIEHQSLLYFSTWGKAVAALRSQALYASLD